MNFCRYRSLFGLLCLCVIAPTTYCADDPARKEAEQFAQYGFTRILFLNMQIALMKREAHNEILNDKEADLLAVLIEQDDAWMRAGLYKVDQKSLDRASEHLGMLDGKAKIRNLDLTLKLLVAANKLCLVRLIEQNPDVPLKKIIDHVKAHADNKSLKTADGWAELRK